MAPEFRVSDRILETARREGRASLHEHEVYDLLKALGIGSPLPYVLAKPGTFPAREVAALPGETLVLKIVHPKILHKSDVGGVRFAKRGDAEETVRTMLKEVPSKASVPAGETVGVLITPKVTASSSFGRELLCGIRDTREFGPVVTVGLGGLDTELFARELRKGRSAVSTSPALSDSARLARLFEATLSFQKLTGRTRDRQKTAEDAALRELLTGLHAMALHYSSRNPTARFWIDEFETNPFLFEEGRAVPVDGILTFRSPDETPPAASLKKFDALLKPERICLIGVSGKSMNVGRIILKNLLDGGIPAERIVLIREDGAPVDGVTSYPEISKLPGRFDLMILSIPAADVPDALEETVRSDKTESIILITGGMGETSGGKTIEKRLKETLAGSRATPSGGPILVGGNCLGIVSAPGTYDTLFIPESRMPRNRNLPLGRNAAIVSQSGAFMITRMNRMGGFVPRYAISTGNQIDVGTADFLEHLNGDDEVKTLGCYIEGFRDREGIRFALAAREAVRKGKEVVVYKAGRSPAGKKAAGGHTAAVAGDWDVAREILTQAGCIFATSLEEWSDLFMLSSLLAGKPRGKGRVAVTSNAGCETVAAADQTGGADALELAQLTEPTVARVRRILEQFKLSELQEVRNPMDLTPMANDRAHIETVQAFHDDPNVDLIVQSMIPLTALIRAGLKPDDPEGYVRLLLEAVRSGFRKPLVSVLDAGGMYDPIAQALLEAGVPVFRSVDRALAMLAKWIHGGNHA